MLLTPSLLDIETRGRLAESTADWKSGQFRTVLTGQGRTLADAFASLEHTSGVERLSRHDRRNLHGARINLAMEKGQGYWELAQLGEEIYVVIKNLDFRDPHVELVPGDGLVRFCFLLSGDLTIGCSGTEPLRLNRPGLLVYNQPVEMDLNEWTAPGLRERCVTIAVRRDCLFDTFFSSIIDVPTQMHALVSGTQGEFRYHYLPLNAQMFGMASRLFDNPYVGALGLIHTEAIALELLCAGISSFAASAHLPNQEYSERNLRRLYVARSFLMKQLSPAPTISQVARAAGINKTSLKRGFKAVFGETIFSFSVRCRMQQALILLRDRPMSVSNVAEAVGYSHQTSFATAFRRHFGFRPTDIRARALP